MKAIFLYRPKKTFKSYLIIWINKIIGNKVYVWGNNSGFSFTEKMKFPDEVCVRLLQKESRKIVDEFINTNCQQCCLDSKDFFKKKLDLISFDYLGFLKGTENFEKIKVYGDPNLQKIFFDEDNKINIDHHFHIVLYIYLTLAALKHYFSTILVKKKSELLLADILYVRKKDTPDKGEFQFLSNNVKNFCGVIPVFKRNANFMSSFSNYPNIGNLVFKSYINALKIIHIETKKLKLMGLGVDLAKSYISANFNMYILAKLNFKILLGVFSDKPSFILIKRYLSHGKLIYGINESFLYPPFRTLDFLHLDKYYCMNLIEANSINLLSGNISKMHIVPFFRHLKSSNYRLPSFFEEKFTFYKYAVLIAPCYIDPNDKVINYAPKQLLINFIEIIIHIARLESDILFVIKEKKGELGFVENSLIEYASKLGNVFIVRSHEHSNVFIPLLMKCNLLVSLCPQSTTFLQALALKIPAISMELTHGSSCFSDSFDSFYSVPIDLHNRILYWLRMDDSKKLQMISDFSYHLNVLPNRNGLDDIAADLNSLDF